MRRYETCIRLPFHSRKYAPVPKHAEGAVWIQLPLPAAAGEFQTHTVAREEPRAQAGKGAGRQGAQKRAQLLAGHDVPAGVVIHPRLRRQLLHRSL